MRRLTIHLKDVGLHAPFMSIKNTLSFVVKNDEEVQHHLNMHGYNVKKYYLSNIK